MYMIVGKEVADVDLSCFEEIGYIQDKRDTKTEVVARPHTDHIIALKGQASSEEDDTVDCQNTLFITLEIPDVGSPNDCSLKPLTLYRYTGENKCYQSSPDFVELMYEHPLGILKLRAYFLVCADECDFAIRSLQCVWNEEQALRDCTLQELWDEEYIKRVNNG